MVFSPFCALFALVISYGDFDLPQHLLVDFAHRRAERCHGRGGVEVENTQKVFVFVVIAGFQPAAGHESVCDADGSRVSELYADVEIIILFQERIGNVVENIPLIGVPVFVRKLCGNSFELFAQTVFAGHVVGAFQHGADAVMVFLTKLPETDSAGVFSCAGVRYIEDIPETRIISAGVDQCDSLGTAAHIASPLLIPEIELSTGGRVGPLSVNHELFGIRVLVQPSDSFQKGNPALIASRDLRCRVVCHLRVELNFAWHFCFLLQKELEHPELGALCKGQIFDYGFIYPS